MKLKRIEMKGFKSFCDYTQVHFNQDITGIVGPNGCGKSNIVDAIRWVMGEQSAKNLRGKNMDDVIFAGSKDREPSSLASVEITFDTKGAQTPVMYTAFEEVSIGRKLFKDGSSEYTINKNQVRLKDVTDFFLGTGLGAKAYSIIEQGRVGQIVTAKPEERRHFIEEAAGISKFQMRKLAAERKMQATQQNLLRLVDIVSEIERQKNSLEKQAKKAEKFKLIRDELKDLDLKMASLDFEKLTERQKNHLENLRTLDANATEASAKIEVLTADAETYRLELLQTETLVSDLQQKLFEWDNLYQITESQLKNKKEASERLKDQDRLLNEKSKETNQKREALKTAWIQAIESSVDADLDALEWQQKQEEIEAEFYKAKEEAQALFVSIESAREQKNSSEKRCVQIGEQKEALKKRLVEKNLTFDEIQNQMTECSHKSERLKSLLDATQSDLADVKQLKLSLSEQSDALEEEVVQIDFKLKSEQTDLAQIKEDLIQKKSRLHSLEELEKNFDGYLDGPRSLLKKKREGEIESILGSVADFIETDPAYLPAVTAVLGENAQTIVVPTYSEGASLAGSLKEMATGRGTFVALSRPQALEAKVKVREVAAAWSHLGVKGVVQDFVTAKAGYENLKEILFSDTLLVETLSEAMNLWQETQCSVATLTGELISKEGILTGGSPERTSLALLEKKQEIKFLEGALQTLMNEVKSKEELCLDLNRKLKTLKADLELMKSSYHEEEIKMTRQEQDMHHIGLEVKSLEEMRVRLSHQLLDLQNEIQLSNETLIELETEEAAQTRVLNESTELLKSTQSQEEYLKQDLEFKQSTLTQTQVVLAEKRKEKSIFEQEVKRLTLAYDDIYKEEIELTENHILNTKLILFWQSRIDFMTKNIARILNQKQEIEGQYRTHKDEYESQNRRLKELEALLQKENRDYSKLKDHMNEESLALSELRNHLGRLSDQIFDRYQLDLSQVYLGVLNGFSEPGFEYAEAFAKAQDLREQLSKAGSVNLSAIDELVEVNERYSFLSLQRSDLEKSLASLEKAIDKINETTEVRFKETFEWVNQKFTQVFPKLFRGGEAYLQLTNPDNLLETGVDIIAQPPGKRLQSISLLSGGEKALTAVSLLFSIFLIKPSPFCLLDEVDAPLDDVNVDRYNEIVRDMAQNTQFIVVTHNKRTMQIADTLYGVTMEQAGVSQLVSVDIS